MENKWKIRNLVQNGFYMQYEGVRTKVNIKPYIVAEFLVLYNFFGHKGPSSIHNSSICARVSGGTRNKMIRRLI